MKFENIEVETNADDALLMISFKKQCPHCKSSRCSISQSDPKEDALIVKYECKNCDCVFTKTYTIQDKSQILAEGSSNIHRCRYQDDIQSELLKKSEQAWASHSMAGELNEGYLYLYREKYIYSENHHDFIIDKNTMDDVRRKWESYLRTRYEYQKKHQYSFDLLWNGAIQLRLDNCFQSWDQEGGENPNIGYTQDEVKNIVKDALELGKIIGYKIQNP